jgi:hypothetical protein
MGQGNMEVLSPNATIYARGGGTNLERLAAARRLSRRRIVIV